MAYKIAAASTDGILVDEHFGSALAFWIIEVNEDGIYEIIQKREVELENVEEMDTPANCEENKDNCKSSCGGGCGKNSSGGSGANLLTKKIDLISDCRSLICLKCGPGAMKQLQRKAITTFEVDLTIQEALTKIIDYYTRIDNHLSLRKK